MGKYRRRRVVWVPSISAMLDASTNVGCGDTTRRARKEVQEAIDKLTDCLAGLGEHEQ